MHKSLLLAPLALILTAAPALACIAVDMGFDPSVANFGDRVTFHASIANTTGDDLIVDLRVTLSVGDFTVGPLHAPLPLPAGQEIGGQFSFTVPALPVTGTLSLTVEASGGGHHDTATASLTILPGGEPGEMTELEAIGAGLLASIATPTPVQPLTWTSVKALYR